jgi:hypothetical protein
MTNLTRASTLVCDPNIQITTQTARAFGGFLELEKAPAKFETTGVGNVDKDYIAFTIYSYAVQQAQEIIGVFRPYLVFGLVMGNAIMDADPLNPVSGTVPKSPGEIASKLVGFKSGNSFMNEDSFGYIIRMYTSDLRVRAGQCQISFRILLSPSMVSSFNCPPS